MAVVGARRPLGWLLLLLLMLPSFLAIAVRCWMMPHDMYSVPGLGGLLQFALARAGIPRDRNAWAIDLDCFLSSVRSTIMFDFDFDLGSAWGTGVINFASV